MVNNSANPLFWKKGVVILNPDSLQDLIRENLNRFKLKNRPYLPNQNRRKIRLFATRSEKVKRSEINVGRGGETKRLSGDFIVRVVTVKSIRGDGCGLLLVREASGEEKAFVAKNADLEFSISRFLVETTDENVLRASRNLLESLADASRRKIS